MDGPLTSTRGEEGTKGRQKNRGAQIRRGGILLSSPTWIASRVTVLDENGDGDADAAAAAGEIFFRDIQPGNQGQEQRMDLWDDLSNFPVLVELSEFEAVCRKFEDEAFLPG